jgi:hypothetical protein
MTAALWTALGRALEALKWLSVVWTVLSGGFLFLCWHEYRRARGTW